MANGINVHITDIAMLPQRLVKSEKEVSCIKQCAHIAEQVFCETSKILSDSSINERGELVFSSETLTSELLRKFMEDRSYELGAIAEDTIVACGKDACDPHNIGSGPIRANELIVVDFFPCSRDTGYFSDVTRTFIKGRPSMDQMRLYDAVKHAQDIAIDMVCDSVEFGQISSEVFHFFDSIGFKTDIKSNHPCGMFHSLGHGFGLDLHESTGDTLKSGMTITIEPGLYYQNIGGIRIEDDVLVHDDGCEILSNIPYDFVIE